MSPTSIEPTPAAWDVFVAYASPDRATAKRVADSLKPYLRVFIDIDQLQLGQHWDQELASALDQSSLVLVLISEHTEQAFFARDELLRAIDRMRRDASVCAVVPVYVGGIKPTHPNVPYGLRPLQGFQLSQDSDLDSLGRGLLARLADLQPTFVEPPSLSRGIVTHYEKIDLQVRDLTAEQYRVIQFLRHVRRVRISGSAGSGKTLVAVEKCARLAAAGRRVLFLCHNPLLAEFVVSLLPKSGVEVADFCGWIDRLSGERSSTDWTHYAEPTSGQLAECARNLATTPVRYDAIVVDEAQDFRDEWWDVVEKALRRDTEATLYLFHDNNQSLLPRRDNYPIDEPHVDLSRNCRNAGRVYELMRFFDTNSPEPEPRLHGLGQVSLTRFEPGHEATALERMVRNHCPIERLESSAVLWSGSEPARESPVAGCAIQIATCSSWQAEVVWQFINGSRFMTRRGLTLPSGGIGWVERQLAGLSTSLAPTAEDRDLVRSTASAFRIETAVTDFIANYASSKYLFRWSVDSSRLTLKRPAKRPTWGAEIVHFFQQPSWDQGIPKPKTVRVVPFEEATRKDHLKLYSVSDFKGLEAETVLLVMRGRITSHRNSLYVAISRARSVLAIATDTVAGTDLPRSFRWDDGESAT